jgi:hypothetical protein
MRRNLALALSAVLRRELDVAAGDVASLDQPLPRELSAEEVTGSRLAAPVSDRSELAGDPALGAGDLRGSGLWWPRQASSPELDSFLAAPARFLAVVVASINAIAQLVVMSAIRLRVTRIGWCRTRVASGSVEAGPGSVRWRCTSTKRTSVTQQRSGRADRAS